MSQIINCLYYEERLLDSLKKKIIALQKKNIIPSLVTILVGHDGASEIYVKNKTLKAKKLGIKVNNYRLPNDTSEEEVLQLIHQLNNDSSVNAILLQLPLPKHLDTQKIISAIDASKDVDGLVPSNLGKLASSKSLNSIAPCTPLAVLYVLKQNTNLCGSNAVVIGRSNLVGLPTALLLIQENATVTVCHSKTKNLQEICQKADIIVSAVNISELIDASFIKKSSILVDVAINRMPTALTDGSNKDYVIVGSVKVNQEFLDKEVSFTPVPKGIGRLTVAFLMYNTYKLTLVHNNLLDDSYEVLYPNSK